MAFCNFCFCENCVTGNVSLKDGTITNKLFRAQCEDGRWICEICYTYDQCTSPFKALRLRFLAGAEAGDMFMDVCKLALTYGLQLSKIEPPPNGDQLQPWYNSNPVSASLAKHFLDKIAGLPIIQASYLYFSEIFPEGSHLNGPCENENCIHRPKIISDWVKNI